MNAWLPTIVTVGLGIAGAFLPQMQDAIKTHPEASVILGALYAIIKGLLPSPVQK